MTIGKRSRPGCRGDTEAPQSWKFDGGPSYVNPGNGAQQINFETLYPADGDTQIATQIKSNAGS